MIYPFALLGVSLMCYLQNQQALSKEPKLTIPDGIQQWCPYTNFCHLDPNATLPVNKQGSHKECCEPCSCSPDCGLKRTCCNAELDRYKLDETLQTICKPLNNKVHLSREESFFYMIDKCPNKSESCRVMKETFLGGYFPVYSRVNGMIYYNSQCAKCHNQTDIIEFLPSFSCPYVDRPFMKMLSKALREDNSTSDSPCFIQYSIPAGIDLSTQICYPSLIRSCDPRLLFQPQFINLCNSLNATFYGGTNLYQNVYCFLCRQSNEILSPDIWREMHTLCPVREHKTFDSHSSLTVLLDKKSITDYTKTTSGASENSCVDLDTRNSSMTKTCRPVYCPEGHFRVDGTCTTLGQAWYVRYVQIYLNLTTLAGDPVLSINDLRGVTIDQLKSPNKDFFRRPELQDWEVELFYNQKENDTAIQYIIAVLSQNTQLVNPKRFISKVSKALRQTWTLNLKESVFELAPNLNQYVIYYIMSRDNDYTLSPHFFGKRGPHTDVIKAWTTVRWSEFFNSKRWYITKLFFCEQVELFSDEFVKRDAGVYIIKIRKFLGNGEFAITLGTNLNPREIRVCLSDAIEGSNGFGNVYNLQVYKKYLICGLVLSIILIFLL